jgi:hypothetical protein
MDPSAMSKMCSGRLANYYNYYDENAVAAGLSLRHFRDDVKRVGMQCVKTRAAVTVFLFSAEVQEFVDLNGNVDGFLGIVSELVEDLETVHEVCLFFFLILINACISKMKIVLRC